LLDVPNDRSSHRVPVPRLGGAAFIPVVLLAVAGLNGAGPGNGLGWAAVAGAAALYVVSLVDDLRPLSTGVRFGVQFAVAGLILGVAQGPLQALAGGWSGTLGTWLRPGAVGYWLLALWFVGLINVYNFMDGIDGIAGLQAVVAGVAWAVIGSVLGLPTVQLVGAVVAAAALGFLTLNWHPAKIFMGDAGSTVLGFFFSTLPFLATVESAGRLDLVRSLTIGAILVWPFLADGIFTFLRRLKNRENVLQAHRSHLYQRLVIAGHNHARVMVAYGCLAVLGAVLALPLIKPSVQGSSPIPAALGVLAVAFLALWRWTVRSEAKRGLQR
jgi:UDP-N-acetylmuramyl pentapeptide phosphotransferase/UDP-N-acetylglucosamine-1-phosphate transferase